jgi:glycosyltransferase involved in cell wall biosynthesis
MDVTVVIPCLNEGPTIAGCIEAALRGIVATGKIGEVVVADNGSGDESVTIALDCGARVVSVEPKGYGAALLGGIAAARGRYVIIADADGSYDLESLAPFVELLDEGYDLVIGNRFRGGIEPGAMPPLHRYVGNPVLSGIGRLLYGGSCRDFHCGIRAFSKQSVDGLRLRAPGMEFASEMIIKALATGLRVTEVPVTLWPDGRIRPPHLRTWQDGWRHLTLMINYRIKTAVRETKAED